MSTSAPWERPSVPLVRPPTAPTRLGLTHVLATQGIMELDLSALVCSFFISWFLASFGCIYLLFFHFLADINECTLGTANCNLTVSSCQNTPGSYNCECLTGTSGDGCSGNNLLLLISYFFPSNFALTPALIFVAAQNFCANSTLNNCSSNAACTSIFLGFTCACNAGYSGNGVNCTGELKRFIQINLMRLTNDFRFLRCRY